VWTRNRRLWLWIGFIQTFISDQGTPNDGCQPTSAMDSPPACLARSGRWPTPFHGQEAVRDAPKKKVDRPLQTNHTSCAPLPVEEAPRDIEFTTEDSFQAGRGAKLTVSIGGGCSGFAVSSSRQIHAWRAVTMSLDSRAARLVIHCSTRVRRGRAIAGQPSHGYSSF